MKHHLMLAILFGMTIGIVSMLVDAKIKEYKPKQPETKPCKPLSLQQLLLYTEKRIMLLDQLETAKKKDKKALQDSCVKYTKLLVNCDSSKYNWNDMFETEN